MPKTHDKAMENLDQKLEAKQEAIKKAEKDLKHAKKVTSINYAVQFLFHTYPFLYKLKKVPNMLLLSPLQQAHLYFTCRRLRTEVTEQITIKRRRLSKSGFLFQF